MAARQGYEFGPTGKAGTGAAGSGAGVGVAIGEIIVHLVPSLEPVSAALNIIIAAVLAAGAAAIATKYTPSASVKREQEKAAHEWELTEGRGAPTPVAAAPVTDAQGANPEPTETATVHITGTDAYGDLDRLAAGEPKHRA